MEKPIKIECEYFRRDIEAFLKLSGVRECENLKHHPFIVFLIDKEDNMVLVKTVKNIKDLIEFQPETKVIAQWEGKWKSDFFEFFVKDVLLYIKKNPKESYHVA